MSDAAGLSEQQNDPTKFGSLPHILVVDDDDRIRSLVSRYLMENEFVVMTAPSAAAARDIRKALTFDAIVADIMMPDETGLAYTQSLREQGDNIPVLLLTALGEAGDRITGLESGADDYLSKPFEPRELVLRLKAILKRSGSLRDNTLKSKRYKIGPFVYDPAYKTLDREGASDAPVILTGVEDRLLLILSERSGQVVSREELAQLCDIDEGSRTIDVQITRLRKKIEPASKAPRYIQTVRGKGYMVLASEISE